MKKIASRWLAQDPAEEWETPYTEREGGFYFRGYYAGHPSIPQSMEDLPAGAYGSLHDACCVAGIGQLLVIPSCVRLIGRGGWKVITPLEVLAVGARVVGLWTEKPEPGVKVTIPLGKLCAIEDVHILLYGRLSFIACGQRLTIRYNTVCRRVLEPLLSTLRKTMAGRALEVPRTSDQGTSSNASASASIPYKWSFLLNYPFSTLDETAPRAFQFSEEPRARHARRRASISRGHLMIVTPYELVSLRDPPESLNSYGVDSLYIPRTRIQGIAFRSNGMDVRAGGASFALPLTPRLASAVGSWFPHPAQESSWPVA